MDNNQRQAVCVWTYQVRPEAEQEFLALLRQHWPVLRRLEFVCAEPPVVLRSIEAPLVYIEQMTWEAAGMRPAHDHPDVIAIWERFKTVVEERVEHHAVPGMSFPMYERVDLQG